MTHVSSALPSYVSEWIGEVLRWDTLLRTIIEGSSVGDEDKRKTQTFADGQNDDGLKKKPQQREE